LCKAPAVRSVAEQRSRGRRLQPAPVRR